jgi:hypothetical protein
MARDGVMSMNLKVYMGLIAILFLMIAAHDHSVVVEASDGTYHCVTPPVNARHKETSRHTHLFVKLMVFVAPSP